MPMTPFMGVRISWLMFARNCDLASTASSARSFACRSSALADFEVARAQRHLLAERAGEAA